MAKSGGPAVGLDIGSQFIKVAECVPSRGAIAVRALGMAPTPPGCMESSVIVDPVALAQAVKKLLREAGVGAKRSISSVSGQSALVVRVIEVPRMSDAELAETMKWEVERHVPFAASEVMMDFQPINRPGDAGDGQNMEVLLAVAQRDMVDRHVEMLMAAGLTPGAIDVEPLAVSRCLLELGPNAYEQKTVALVNMGASNTDIGIFRDGILAFPRTLPLAGDTLTRAIAMHMGVSQEEAEQLKIMHGEVRLDQVAQPQAQAPDAFLDFSMAPTVPAGEPAKPLPFDFSEPEQDAAAAAAVSTEATEFESPPAAAVVDPGALAPVVAATEDPARLQVFTAIAPVLSELLTELRRSLEYYRGRAGDAPIDEIVLCGGASRLKNLDTFLTQELGVPTRLGETLQYVTVTAKGYSPEHLHDISPAFAVAIGLAARDLVSSPAPLATAGRGRKKK